MMIECRGRDIASGFAQVLEVRGLQDEWAMMRENRTGEMISITLRYVLRAEVGQADGRALCDGKGGRPIITKEELCRAAEEAKEWEQGRGVTENFEGPGREQESQEEGKGEENDDKSTDKEVIDRLDYLQERRSKRKARRGETRQGERKSGQPGQG